VVQVAVPTFRLLGLGVKDVIGMIIEQGCICILWPLESSWRGLGIDNKPSVLGSAFVFWPRAFDR
jgi:hypothetical protein